MGNDDRNMSLVHKIIGHAAEQPFTQAKLTIASLDDDIDHSTSRFGKQSSSDIVFAVIDAVQDGLNAVMLEMIDGIGAHRASCSVTLLSAMTATVTSFARLRNGMPSARARADLRLPFQATRMRSNAIFGRSVSGKRNKCRPDYVRGLGCGLRVARLHVQAGPRRLTAVARSDRSCSSSSRKVTPMKGDMSGCRTRPADVAGLLRKISIIRQLPPYTASTK